MRSQGFGCSPIKGTATAAGLPPGLDVAVYPVREGARLPAPFLEALIRHVAPGCVLAPVGAATIATVPVLAVDLDPAVPAEASFPRDEQGSVAWVEALTPDPNRRRALLAAGLFSVDLNPALFERPGRLAAHAAAKAEPHPGTVRSPMVGTAYRAPAPGAAAFIEVGHEVRQGQTLLIIEVMKTMNQIVAPRTGKVLEIIVNDGRIVAAQQGRWLATSFHPELTGDDRFHRYFVHLAE